MVAPRRLRILHTRTHPYTPVHTRTHPYTHQTPLHPLTQPYTLVHTLTHPYTPLQSEAEVAALAPDLGNMKANVLASARRYT